MTAVQIKCPDWLDFIFAIPILLYRKVKYGYSFRRIYLDEGKWTILDQSDYYRYAGFKWCIGGDRDRLYVIRGTSADPNDIKIVRLHRLIMNAPDGVLVDHRNGNSLDNRRSNLRLATRTQNAYNARKRKNTSSRYIGVHWDKRARQWKVQIRVNGKDIWLGRFDNEIEAARAYDRAAIKYHPDFARLNFPQSQITQIPQTKKNYVCEFIKRIWGFIDHGFRRRRTSTQIARIRKNYKEDFGAYEPRIARINTDFLFSVI